MGKFTFRTIMGGPETPIEFRDELRAIKDQLETVDFEYELDLCLTIGADMITVTHPTGLRSPRISTSKQNVTGTIFINNKDTFRPKDNNIFFRKVIYDAACEIFDRMEAKKVLFSKAECLEKIAFLKTH